MMRRNTLLSVVTAVIIIIYLLTYLASDSDAPPSVPECKEFVLNVIRFIRNLICR